MNEREFSVLAAGHALHALSAADERRFAAARAEHPEWQTHADDDARTAAELAAALEPVAPPPALRETLLDRIATMPQDAREHADAGGAGRETAPQRAEAAVPRKRWSRAALALAACLVLLVGGGIATALVVSQVQRPAAVVALDAIRSAPDAQQASVPLASGGIATAHWSGQLGEAVLVASGLEHPKSGKTYELWFVRGDRPISAGVFEPDDGSATALLAGAMKAGDVIAVTVEQDGGSPSGVPTSTPVIIIPTA